VRHRSRDGRVAGAGDGGEPEPEFVDFVRAVRPTLERLLKRLAPAGVDPFDLAAEALARTYARWATLGEVENKRAWVLRVATNLAYDARSRQARRETAGDGRRGPAQPRFEDAVADRALLRPALRALPRRQREAVALHYLADLPVAEVARVMGVSIETAKTHVERGRSALRRSLGGHLPQEVGTRDE
jgi:RNA polymerase sigma factor (sigma-70 family)